MTFPTLLLLAIGSQAPAAATLPWGVLVDAAVDLGQVGEAYSGVVRPTMTGDYGFEIRYPFSDADVDARSPGSPRRFAAPHHEAFGGGFRARVIETDSGRELPPKTSEWLPVEARGSGGATCGDRVDFALRAGISYRVCLMVDEASPALKPLGPRFVVESLNSTRNNAIGRKLAGAALVSAVLVVVVVFILILIVLRRRGLGARRLA